MFVGRVQGDPGRLARVGQGGVGVQDAARQADLEQVHTGVNRHLVDFRITDQKMIEMGQVGDAGGVGARRRELPGVDGLNQGARHGRQDVRCRCVGDSVERDFGYAPTLSGSATLATVSDVQAPLVRVVGGIATGTESHPLCVL